MKNLLEYIQKKHIKIQRPCFQVLSNLTDEEIHAIDTIADDFLKHYNNLMTTYNLKKITVADFFRNYAGEDTTNLFLVLAYMLAEDNTFDLLNKIGFTGYPGNNNPYDFSCFEEETDDRLTTLDYMQLWLKNNAKAKDKFLLVHNGVNKNLADFKNASDFLNKLIDVLQ